MFVIKKYKITYLTTKNESPRPYSDKKKSLEDYNNCP